MRIAVITKTFVISLILGLFTHSEAAKAQSYQTINYIKTNYSTDGNGGWTNGGRRPDSAVPWSVSDSKIINNHGESFSYSGEAMLFNIPVSVYACDTNNNFFVLRSGNELIYVLTNMGLFMAELQLAGGSSQRLTRYNIPGYYNVNTALSGTNSGSSSADGYTPVQVLEIHSGMSITTTHQIHHWYKRFYGNRWCLYPVKGGAQFYTASPNNDRTCEGYDVSGYAYKAINPSGTSAYGIRYYYFN